MAKFTVAIDDKYLPILNEMCGGTATDNTLSDCMLRNVKQLVEQKYINLQSSKSIDDKLTEVTAS